ncbi:MAG: efflux RND transporter permease subunit, partial [Phycisphaerales bacterium]|nr:efflux RND transporter permease subunit [Phycisphaerales bacterium]
MSLARFGVRKPVPVNLLMVSLIIGGLWVSTVIRREFFPEMQPEQASVLLPYPGATPEEVEESLARKVEDAIWDLDEVDELTTSLNEGGGVITVGFREGIGNIDKAVDEVERVVNALTDLPDDAERLQVTEFEPRMPVIMVSVYGDADEGSMKEAIRGIRDDLKTLPGMGEVTIGGVRDYEVRVDVDLLQLLEHGMSLPQVSDAIRRWMSDIPGGSVRNDAGNVSVRTIGVPERAEAIREIIVRADADGQAVRVGDIATVTESFVDTQIQTRFNGRPSVSLTVYKQLGQDIVSMAEMVRAYVRARQGEPFEAQVADRFTGLMRDMKTGEPRKTNRRIAYDLGATSAIPLPSGCRIDDHSDLARFVEGRLDLLLNNAMWGAMLVFGTLLVFLNWRVAFWVGMGLVTALSGTLVIMYVFDVTLNLLTMFGLIVVLGLLVDDAIVVAENIQAKHDRGESSLAAAISGAEAVTWPVVATVLTSIVAFLPLTFVRGSIGDLLGALPMVVACALAMSLVESLLILPCHMGHSLVHRDRAREGRRRSITQRYETFRDGIIHDRIIPAYAWVVTRSLRYRYMFIAFALAILIISFGFVAGGRIGYTFLPKSDSETIIVDIRMPIGTALARTDEIVAAIEAAAFEQDEVNSISAIVGQNANLDTGSVGSSATHIAQMFIELKPVESRQRESSVIIDAIRERTAGHTDGADSVKYSEITGGPGGPGITVKVRSNEDDVRLEVVDEIKHLLAGFAGVQDIADDNTLGQEEMQIRLKPGAAALGFTVTDVATQVRGALFGLEPHVFAARQEDIDVRVRLDERTRRSLMQVESMWIISPSGALVPLTE